MAVRSGTRESDFPHRHFFPLRALIDSDLPSRRDIEAVFGASGFTLVVHQVVTQVTAPNWPSFVEKSALRADSFLARLPDADFQRGMAALRNPGDAIGQNDAVTEEIDWFVFTRHGSQNAQRALAASSSAPMGEHRCGTRHLGSSYA